MKYPEHEPIKEEKPISELAYRIITLILVLGSVFLSIAMVLFKIPPVGYIKHLLHLSADDAGILWLIVFFGLLMMGGIFMRLLKPFADVPQSPYGNLNIKTFFKGDADQDEYKINDNN